MIFTVSENGVSRKPVSKLSALCQYRSARPLLEFLHEILFKISIKDKTFKISKKK